jgi:uncharacterized protein YjdB
MNRRHCALGALLLPAALGPAACDGGSTGVPRSEVASVRVAPDFKALAPGGTTSLHATAYDASGAELTGQRFFWASSDTTIASVSQDGVVASRAPGSAQVAASTGGTSGFARISVQSNAPASVGITPASVTLTAISETVQLHAQVRDADGRDLPDSPVEWQSLDRSIATVTSGGVATAVGNGVATITASSGPARGTATLRVEQRTAALQVAPSTASVAVGDTVRFRATATDAGGSAVRGVTVAWSTSKVSVASVDQNGLARGAGTGEAILTASAGGRSATATLTVTQSPEPPPPPPSATAVNIVSGNGQKGKNGEALKQLLVVRVVGSRGQPVAGIAVAWTTNNGSVTPTLATTDADGLASTRWTLGGGSKDTDRRAFATVAGLPPAVFTAKRD